MKNLLLPALAVVALLAGVACVDITPYPLVESDAGADAVDPDAAVDGGPEP